MNISQKGTDETSNKVHSLTNTPKGIKRRYMWSNNHRICQNCAYKIIVAPCKTNKTIVDTVHNISALNALVDMVTSLTADHYTQSTTPDCDVSHGHPSAIHLRVKGSLITFGCLWVSCFRQNDKTTYLMCNEDNNNRVSVRIQFKKWLCCHIENRLWR